MPEQSVAGLKTGRGVGPRAFHLQNRAMRRYLFPLIFGLAGVAILCALGIWQLQRLGEKEAMLAAIESRIHQPAVPLASLGAPNPATERYRAVTMTGRTTGDALLVITGRKGMGAGYEVIEAFETDDGRRVLLDRGFIPEVERPRPRPPAGLEVTGNLDWPSETDSFTPPPDPGSNLWFARDVAGMARALKTEPLMIVARDVEGDVATITPVPVTTEGIPNNHLNYAITWFLLAVAWAAMSGYAVWRVRTGRQ